MLWPVSRPHVVAGLLTVPQTVVAGLPTVPQTVVAGLLTVPQARVTDIPDVLSELLKQLL
ncbi:MAG: hypothetical protein JW829_05280 [Pirellulales bacterium]|nr:hypothetical protein [Pirellulales bacterium]